MAVPLAARIPQPLTGIPFARLAERLESRARAAVVRRWLFERPGLPVALPEQLEGVAQEAWARLRAEAPLPQLRVVAGERAVDGTTKLLLDCAGAQIESVVIPTARRTTVCVSSQSGCTRACRFCATARVGFARSLLAGEIVAQVALARAYAPLEAPVRNVVFMGMGEPMDNLDEVLPAVEVLTESPGLGLAPSRVTVSTSGVVPGMRRFLEESRAQLALSLNGSTDAQREQLMPHTRTWPIGALVDVLREDAVRRPGRTHFVEYVLFDGVNDAPEDADRVVALLRGLPARLNLIPHNPFPGSVLLPPPDERVRGFQRRVADAGLRCIVRWPRGQDIAAACGQLAGKSRAAHPTDTAVA